MKQSGSTKTSTSSLPRGVEQKIGGYTRKEIQNFSESEYQTVVRNSQVRINELSNDAERADYFGSEYQPLQREIRREERNLQSIIDIYNKRKNR